MMFSQHKTAAFKKCAAFAVGAATFALAQGPEAQAKETAAHIAARKAITQNYEAYNRAFKNKDIATFMSFLAPDYEHYTMVRLRQDRTVFENLNRNLFNLSISYVSVTTKIQKIQWRGPDAIVWVANSAATSASSSHWTQRDYWSPTKAGWKLRQVTELTYN